MTIETILRLLNGLNLRLSVKDGRVRIEGPVSRIDPQLRHVLALRKGELLAVLSGREVACEGYPEMVWDPRGGVRLAKPPDFRSACLAEASLQGFPELRVGNILVRQGASAWSEFTARADRSRLCEALVKLMYRSSSPAANNHEGDAIDDVKGVIDGVQGSSAAA